MQKNHRNGRSSTRMCVEDEIAHLRGLDLGGLRARWQSEFQRSAPAHLTRHLLFAVIAYRLQVDRFGDLDHATKQVLDRAIAKEAGAARSTSHRRLCRAWTRQAPDRSERKNRRTADPTDAKEDRRWRLRNALPIEKASGGTGVRTDQAGARIPPIPVAGRRKSACRMGHDLHRPQPPEAVHPRKCSPSRLTCQ